MSDLGRKPAELPGQIVNALRDAGLGTAFAADILPLGGDEREQRWIWQRPGGPLQIALLSATSQPKVIQLILETLAGTGIAPELRVQMITTTGVVQVVTDPGQTHWSGAPEPVAETLGALHRIRPPKGLPGLPGTSADLITAGLARLESIDHPDATVLRADLPESPDDILPEEPAFLHGNPCPARIVMQGNRAILTGWQSTGIGDPSHDLATFLSPAIQTLRGRGPITPMMRARFLHAYPLKRAVARMIRLRDAYHWYRLAVCVAERNATKAERRKPYDHAFELERRARDAARNGEDSLEEIDVAGQDAG